MLPCLCNTYLDISNVIHIKLWKVSRTVSIKKEDFSFVSSFFNAKWTQWNKQKLTKILFILVVKQNINWWTHLLYHTKALLFFIFYFCPIDHKMRDVYLHYCSNIRTCCHTCMYQRDSEQEKYLRKYL